MWPSDPDPLTLRQGTRTRVSISDLTRCVGGVKVSVGAPRIFVRRQMSFVRERASVPPVPPDFFLSLHPDAPRTWGHTLPARAAGPPVTTGFEHGAECAETGREGGKGLTPGKPPVILSRPVIPAFRSESPNLLGVRWVMGLWVSVCVRSTSFGIVWVYLTPSAGTSLIGRMGVCGTH